MLSLLLILFIMKFYSSKSTLKLFKAYLRFELAKG